MHGSAALKTAIMLLGLMLSGVTYGLEPVTALDDGFAVPSKAGLIEASLHFPGAESFITGPFAVAAWTRPFGVDDLSVTTVHAGTRFGKAGISLSCSGCGFDLYGDESEKIGFSYAFLDRISCGIRLTRSAMRIRGFGNAYALSADGGVVFRPVESVWVAGSYEDMSGAELGESREPLDGRTRLSAAWSMTGDFTLLCSASKVRLYDTSFSGGFTAGLSPLLTVGVTGASEPDRMEFLGMVHIRGLTWAYRGSYHRDLGMSHGFSMCWTGQRKTARDHESVIK